MKSDRCLLRIIGAAGLPIFLGLFFALILGGCRQPDEISDSGGSGPAWFEDITDKVGLKFLHESGPLPVNDRYYMPQLVGSGAALFDYDNDGRLDIYLIQNSPDSGARNRLFHQESDGSFKDVSEGSGLDVSGAGMGVAIGDVNNDGLPDVLLTERGRIRLFLNLGHGKFKDVTEEAGLHDTLWATSAAFFDYDRDGWLDLVVANYVDYKDHEPCKGLDQKPDYCGPQPFQGTMTKLFHNKGAPAPGGVPRFEDVTSKAGLDTLTGPDKGAGLGVVVADFNGDHWPDVLISNDGKRNHLWINQKNGTFLEEAKKYNIAYDAYGKAMAGMGIAVGDIKGDGRLSVFMPHLDNETNTLWTMTANGMFKDETYSARVGRGEWTATGFGAAFVDFNHDGLLDLAIVNGGVQRGAAPDESFPDPFWKWYVQRNQLFVNEGGGRFKDISSGEKAFCGTPLVGRGLAFGSVTNDGAVDILVTAVSGPARLYKNVAPKSGHWLMVKAVDPALGGRDAYGAELTVTAGGRRWIGAIQPASSYLCSNDPRAHFGLGAVDKVDVIHVVWPDGTEEAFPSQAVDRVVVLKKGASKAP
jgi:hypothetical protein